MTKHENVWMILDVHIDQACQMYAHTQHIFVRGLKPPNQVREDKSKVVTLKCSECEQTMTSSWFFKHPTKASLHVLLPAMGHSACRIKTGKRCPWLPVDGRPHKLDIFDHLDYCEHTCLRTVCIPCGGSGICEHQKQYANCKLCRGRRRGSRIGKGRPSSPEDWLCSTLTRLARITGLTTSSSKHFLACTNPWPVAGFPQTYITCGQDCFCKYLLPTGDGSAGN